MAYYKIKNLGFKYPQTSKWVIKNISMTIDKGDFILLCGPSGSGKTTLLRQLKKQVQPEGDQLGKIFYKKIDLEELDERISSQEIAMIFQDPDNQIVMNTVEQELAFAMENMGYSQELMQRRIGEIVNYFGIESLLEKSIHELSGGQKQLLNLASVMVLRPRVLLLDEPTAQLDPIAAKEFLEIIHRINQEMSITIVISEHRIEELFPLANQIFLLNKGEIVYSGDPNHIIENVWEEKDLFFYNYLPAVSQLYLKMDKIKKTNKIPITVREGYRWFDNFYSEHISGFKTSINKSTYSMDKTRGDKVLECKEVYFQYEKDSPLILKGLSCTVERGDLYVLLGGNGAGKSTLLKIFAGIFQAQRGKIYYNGKNIKRISQIDKCKSIGYVAQNPLVYFTRETVEIQMKERMKELGLKKLDELKSIMDLFNLEEILQNHPHDISGGQQQKLALALVLLANPEIIILDEPTKGLDPISKINLASLLKDLRSKGKTILMVSHDIEFAASYATKCGMLFNGEITGVTDPKNFFKDNYFYTTTIHRSVGEIIMDAITVEDVTSLWST